MNIQEIKFNLKQIRRQIRKACQKSKRNPEEVKLEVVTKGASPEIIGQLAKLGFELFGENRIKQTLINKEYFGTESEVHMIGHLDTNDAKKAVRLYHLIESLDSVRLAEKLNYQAQKQHKIMPVFLQLKTDCQLTKHGFSKEEFLSAAIQINKLPYLKILGLMTLPPLTNDAEKSRPYFQKLKRVKEKIKKKLKLNLLYLSMGTSQDFEAAIEEGADIIRLGRSIFGFSHRGGKHG